MRVKAAVKARAMKILVLLFSLVLIFPAFKWDIVTAKESNSNAISIIENNVRVQLLSDTIVRIETKGANGFEDRPTMLVPDRSNWDNAEYVRTETSSMISLTTKNYVVRIPIGATRADDVIIEDTTEKLLWRSAGNTTANVYLPSPSDELKSWYFTDNRIVPSENGYSTYESETETPLNGWDFSNKATDNYVFLPQGSYKQFCEDYIKVTGKSEMITKQMLGYWDSRWYSYSSETAIQQIKDYTDKGYSIDILVIDTDWRKSTGSGGIGYDIDTTLFPDMAKFLEQAHELGINIVFNDHPEPVAGTENGLEKPEVDYRNKNIKLLLSLGLDHWWYDRNWHTALETVDDSMSVFAFGMYAYQWMTNEHYESITDVNEYAKRGLIMGNIDGVFHGEWRYASDLSSHRYSIQWTGDIGSTPKALEQEIYATVFGGAEAGLPYLSSDIGGHNQAVTDATYVRWMQYGALSTIFRVHCTDVDAIGQEGRMPWLFGETAEAVTHRYQDMRYRLMPLYYNLANENYNTGLPVMRRLDINYPQYKESSRNDQYLLGDYILVAPIVDGESTVPVPITKLQHTGADGKFSQGLVGSYYNNKDLQGLPVKTVYGDKANYDWQYGGPEGVGNDKFSVEWKGQYKVGDRATRLHFKADDGMRVWINNEKVVEAYDVYDVLKSTKSYPANNILDIEIQYFEDGGGALFNMYESYDADNGASAYSSSRTVFIPDGNWIDVFSGKRYTGPQQINVTHGLETSPIFVREGAIVPLANNGTNTKSISWDKLALDLYPSSEYDASQNIYEDDDTTVAYKSGMYRNTNVSMTKLDTSTKKLNVNIAKATGKYTTKYNSREWTLRMHMPSEWGQIKNIKVDGVSAEYKYFTKSYGADPFANKGSSADSEIYEITFSADISKASNVEFEFEASALLTNATTYDKTEQVFEVNVEQSNRVDLTNGYSEYAVFGMNGVERINSQAATGAIGVVDSYKPLRTSGYYNVNATYNNGGRVTTARGSVNSQKNIDFTLKTKPGVQYYSIYLGGFDCLAKLTVRDRSGKNIKTEVFGNHDAGFSRGVVIKVDSAVATELFVTYATLSTKPDGTGTFSAVSLSAIAVSSEMPTISNDTVAAVTAIKASQTEIKEAATLDLSAYNENHSTATPHTKLDWLKVGYYPGAVADLDTVKKAGGGNIEVPMFASPGKFYDYKMGFTWSGGEEVATQTTAVDDGLCTSGRVDMFVKVEEGTNRLVLWTGAWNSDNTVTIFDMNGKVLARSTRFNGDSNSMAQRIAFDITATGGQSYVQVAITGGGSNVSLAAVSLLKR